MRMTGEQRIPVERRRLWAALNDPEVLRRCLPGCQTLDREGEDRFAATMEVRIGPIGARFKGTAILSDIVPGEAYTLTGQGHGGIAGSAKGSARVRLADVAGGTLLAYEVTAEVGGRMAQLGGPIIDATAKQLAALFFTRLADAVKGTEETGKAETGGTEAGRSGAIAPPASAATGSSTHDGAAATSGAFPWGWLLALAVGVLAGFLAGRSGLVGGWVLALMLLAVAAAGAGFDAGRRSHGRCRP